MTRISLAALLAAPFLASPALAQSPVPAGTTPGGVPVYRVDNGPAVAAVPPVAVPVQLGVVAVPVAPGAAVAGQPGYVIVPAPGAVPGAVPVQPGVAPRAAYQGNTRVGQLVCDASAGIGLILGSSRALDCEFRPVGGLPPERYVGRIGRFGVDVGYTGPATLVWTVINTGPDVQPGSLAGRYVGVGSSASLGVGLGSNALVGGSGDQVALQPLSLETNTGIGVAAGIADLSLQAAR